jgi:hypothetical protein
MDCFVGTFWALEVGLQILFKVFEGIGYSFRVLQPVVDRD